MKSLQRPFWVATLAVLQSLSVVFAPSAHKHDAADLAETTCLAVCVDQSTPQMAGHASHAIEWHANHCLACKLRGQFATTIVVAEPENHPVVGTVEIRRPVWIESQRPVDYPPRSPPRV